MSSVRIMKPAGQARSPPSLRRMAAPPIPRGPTVLSPTSPPLSDLKPGRLPVAETEVKQGEQVLCLVNPKRNKNKQLWVWGNCDSANLSLTTNTLAGVCPDSSQSVGI